MDVPIRRLAIRTEDGFGLRAESVMAPQAEPAPPCGLVVCHPHPLHGGNMFNPVVTALFSAASSLELPALRFNFRGTNGSEGSYSDGVGEQIDATTAVDWLNVNGFADDDREPQPRIVLAGYSFGADVALKVNHPAVAGWLAIAPPLKVPDAMTSAAGSDRGPTLILSGTADQFRNAEAADGLISDWQNTTVSALAGADHFLTTELRAIHDHARTFLQQVGQGLSSNNG